MTRLLACMTLLAGMSLSPLAFAETVATGTSVSATHVVGLTDIKSNVKGTLEMTPEALTFASTEATATIARNRILAASVGDQQTERGGMAGRIARMAIPYGGGMALGAVSNQSVDLLTVEYRDVHEGYHAVVFVLASKTAAELQQKIAATVMPVADHEAFACTSVASPGSVLVAPIESSGIELPAEYRATLYEQLIAQLHKDQPAETYLRAGDTSAGPGCTATTLRIAVSRFDKGSQHVRASSGPLRVFLGKTTLTFKVTLTGTGEKQVFEANLRKSNSSDSDSLNVAKTIAKTVSKRLKKEMKKAAIQAPAVS